MINPVLETEARQRETTPKPKLRAAVIGLGIGKSHAQVLSTAPGYELAAVCDVSEQRANESAKAHNTRAVTSLKELWCEVKPDVAVICTPNATHADFTIEALEAGVRAVYCEKPMATNLADARRMLQACQERGVPLIVGHQRRLMKCIGQARQLIQSGALGEIEWIRGASAGDLLSDGTHLIDTLFFLAGDGYPESVLGMIHREIEAKGAATGFRYGHPVETGAAAIIDCGNKLRMEVLTGDMRGRRVYHDYEVFGTRGRLWQTGNNPAHFPFFFIMDDQGGTWEAQVDPASGVFRPRDLGGQPRPGLWRVAQTGEDLFPDALGQAYAKLIDTVENGTEHPLRGELALRNLEVLIAIYESARLRKKVRFPVEQMRFPLEILVEDGAF
jgi:UDP-N-acetyl-2-amino-2-deoxyglucuronate dehydrogenase